MARTTVNVARPAPALQEAVDAKIPVVTIDRYVTKVPDLLGHVDTEEEAMNRFLTDEIEAALNTLPPRDAKVLRTLIVLDPPVMPAATLGERLRSAMRTDAAVYDTRFAFDYYRPLPDTRLPDRIHAARRPPCAHRRAQRPST